jgi:phosphoribosyl 1,2-cyclic phosphodiesterase/CheY-like chemotaxis protein
MKKVLIIDDDSSYRSLLAEILQMHGWQVVEADEGEAGLAMVRHHRPEFVLCDLLMPRCNGFHVCRTIRGDVTLRNTKIVVTSGRDYEADRLAAREAGADEYLTKPIKPDDLVAVLARLGAVERVFNPDGKFAAGSDALPARLKFWGVRGSIPVPGSGTVRFGGNTSCVEVRAQGEIIILDAGTGLRALGNELTNEFKDRPFSLTLLLSHTHWDHIQGLPFFQPMYNPQCHLRILGYEGARKGLVHVLSGQMESPYFPVPFGELPGNIEIEELKEMSFRVGPVLVHSWFANHPGICVGYCLFTGKSSVAFFPDNEPRGLPRANSTALAYVKGEEQKTIEFLHGVDVLILDSQYDAEEYKERAGWGHGCVDDAVELALKAGIKTLYLFHHDPDHDDDKVEAMLAHARKLVSDQKASLQIEAAREGEVVELTGAPRPEEK